MSHLTRCPACTTVFRIEDSQLHARQGFVRCGQCAKVFDARASLVAERDAAHDDAPPDIELYLGPASSPPAVAPAPLPPLPPLTVAPPATPTTAPDVADNIALPVLEPLASEEPVEPPEYSLAEADESPPNFPFGPEGRERNRAAVLLWGLASLVMLIGLCAQAAYLFRSELALAVPSARPYLELACHRIGCDVPPPRDLPRLSIESSDLQVDAAVPGLLTLNATLRNRATFAQAHPAIELTLTDAEDRPLARRVLLPPDYLGERLTREPRFAAASEHAVRLHVDATAVRPTGYRLLLFFP